MRDPKILTQRAKVQLIPNEEFEGLNPRRVAVVEVTLNDGTHLSQRVDAVRGTTENPMTREDVASKARDLMSPILGEGACAKLITVVLGLESVKNIRELGSLLTVSR